MQDSWRHETLRLYAAQGDATPILTACLAVNTVTSLTLAAEIIEEGAREISEDVRAKVEAHLIAGLTADDPALRKLAAEIKLARRLSMTRSNSFRRLDDQSEADTVLITCAEYQLFLDEAQQQGLYHQPSHWTSLSHPLELAEKPALGVSPDDAMAFCLWLNRWKVGQYTYRLPNLVEAMALLFGDTNQAYWVHEATRTCLNFTIEWQRLLQPISSCNVPFPSSDPSNYALTLNEFFGPIRSTLTRFAVNIPHLFEVALGLDFDRSLMLASAVNLTPPNVLAAFDRNSFNGVCDIAEALEQNIKRQSRGIDQSVILVGYLVGSDS